MSPEQLVALLATIADLHIVVERLRAENNQLHQIIAERLPDDSAQKLFETAASSDIHP